MIRHDYPWQLLLVLALGVFVPTACVIWFMSEAMSNERLVANQKVAALYQQRFEQVREQLRGHWVQKFEALESLDPVQDEAILFADVVRQRLASSVLIRNQRGEIRYPSHTVESQQQMPSAWSRAQTLERHDRNFDAASRAYQDIANTAKHPDIEARAYLALARIHIQLKQYPEAIEILTTTLAESRFNRSQDALGRLIQPNAQLLALQVIRSRREADPMTPESRAVYSEYWQHGLDTLVKRLNNYQDHHLKANQRRFLMDMLIELEVDLSFPTHQAEILAARYLESGVASAAPGGLRDTLMAGVLHYVTANNGLNALYDQQAMVLEFERLKATWQIPEGVDITLYPSTPLEQENIATTVLPVGAPLYGWHLGFSFIGESPFDSEASKQISVYLWTGTLIVLTIILLAVVTAGFVGRQLHNSRLKRDLVDTVSHELKTPLSSIRLLVDTLLRNNHELDDTTCEYLHLVAQENARLSQLVENLLTFSRLEKQSNRFEFQRQRPEIIAQLALDAIREKSLAQGFNVEADIPGKLPDIVADDNLLVSALVNLLENALKYSGDSRKIQLRVNNEVESVCFQVKDYGIGIHRKDQGKIFERFYRVDKQLSQDVEGCGLGLNIVDFVVKAHNGHVAVDSQPGTGSLFSIYVPHTDSAAAERLLAEAYY